MNSGDAYIFYARLKPRIRVSASGIVCRRGKL